MQGVCVGTTSWSCPRWLCTGATTRTLVKDTVTPERLLTSLKTLDGDSWRGLAPGQLAFLVDQDRPPPHLLYNVVKDTVAFSQKFRTPRPISPRHGYSRIAPVGATSTLIKDLLSPAPVPLPVT